MAQRVQVYFTDLDPNAVINLDQPCHQPEFGSVSLEIQSDINNEYIEIMDNTMGYWSHLMDHIEQWGVLYPIVVNTGLPKVRSLRTIPLDKRASDSQYWMVCEQIGGLRLLAAQKLGIRVPALINDYVGLFKNHKPLTIRELNGVCVGIDEIEISATFGVRIPHCPRVHIDVEEDIYSEYKSAAIQSILANHPEIAK